LEKCNDLKARYQDLLRKWAALSEENTIIMRGSNAKTKTAKEIQQQLNEISSEETFTDLINAVSFCFSKLDKYYQVQSDLVYSATVLNPTLNIAYFEPVPGQEYQSTVKQVKQEVMEVFPCDYTPKYKSQGFSQESQTSSSSGISRIYRRLI
jgi:predicted alpha/beta-fold hydrolase